MLDATRLRVLVAIARHGSVTAAAQALNYAQPSISHHMARLEAETGAKLMERAGRGIRLTEAGQLLAERAAEILGRIDAAEAELAAHVGLQQDRVRVGAFGSALGTLVAQAARSLCAERAGLDIQLTQAEPAEAVGMLRAGEVDIALVFSYVHEDDGPSPEPPDPADPGGWTDLRCQLLLDEPAYLLRPADHEAGTADSVGTARHSARGGAIGTSLSAYPAERWIAGGSRSKEALVRLCLRAGFSPDIAVSADDSTAVQALVAAGLGTAILPGLALCSGLHPGIRAIELADTRHQVHAVTYADTPGSPACGRLLAALIRAGQSRSSRPGSAALDDEAALVSWPWNNQPGTGHVGGTAPTPRSAR